MARKKLLTEGEVRKFMKLASLGALSENYFSNNPIQEEEEEELEMELGAAEVEEEPAIEEPMDMDMEEPVEDDMMDAPPENEELLQRVVQAVAAELGVEVDVETSDAEGGDDLEVDAELDEPPMEDGAELDAEMEMGPEEEEEVPPGNYNLEESPQPAHAHDTREAMVAEITNRVAARLGKVAKQEKIAAELTERIFRRLTSHKK